MDHVATRAVRGFWIFASGEGAVMEIEDRPGNLISMAAPSGPLATHPWLHGVSRDPTHEHALRQLVLASADFGDFCHRLIGAGYDLLGSGGELYEIDGPARRIQRGAAVVGALFVGIGPPSTLSWQPPDGELLSGPVAITAYDEGLAEALFASNLDASSVEEVVSRLQRVGFSVA